MSSFWGLAERAASGVRTRWWQAKASWLLRHRGVAGVAGVRCFGLPIVQRVKGSTITLAPGVVLCSDARYTDLGVAHPVILRTLRPGARIEVGPDVGVSGAVVCAAVSVQIGSQCLLGAGVQVSDTDFHAIEPEGRRFECRSGHIPAAPVVIEDNVFLGAGARVLKGVRIGRNSVIGAGSVVVSDIPPNVVAAGVPARVLRPIGARNPD